MVNWRISDILTSAVSGPGLQAGETRGWCCCDLQTGGRADGRAVVRPLHVGHVLALASHRRWHDLSVCLSLHAATRIGLLVRCLHAMYRRTGRYRRSEHRQSVT